MNVFRIISLYISITCMDWLLQKTKTAFFTMKRYNLCIRWNIIISLILLEEMCDLTDTIRFLKLHISSSRLNDVIIFHLIHKLYLLMVKNRWLHQFTTLHLRKTNIFSGIWKIYWKILLYSVRKRHHSWWF